MKGIKRKSVSVWGARGARETRQVQAMGMYGAAQPDFFKSETNGGIKNIISHHLKIIKRCVFSPNLEGVAQKISLPRPWEV